MLILWVVDVLAMSAKARQSEPGALKRGGIDLLIMPPKLKGRLPLWRACSVEPLRGLVKPRNQRRGVDRSVVRQNGGTSPT